MTARQAVDVLKNEGLVRSEHGRGVFVRQRPTVHRLARSRFTRQRRETGKGAYDVEMKELGFTPRVELVDVGPVTPPDEIVKRLQLDPGEQALIRRRRMYANDEPMQLATSYIPWSLAQGTPMAQRDTGPGGIYSRLADVGHGPVRFTEDVSTRMPTPEEKPTSCASPRHSRCSSWSASPLMPTIARSRPASTSWPVTAGSSATHGQPIEADARKKVSLPLQGRPCGRPPAAAILGRRAHQVPAIRFNGPFAVLRV